MYVPDVFKLEDRAAAIDLIRAHNFGLLVTAPGGRPTASHLPFLIDEARGPNGTLLAHMARANPQWRDFEALDEEALVVFQGPHAYVSPAWYPPGDHVPTWNYLAVHAYGRPRVTEEAAQVRALLERMVDLHEAGRESPWRLDGQKESYLAAMQRGIVAFEIPITRLEAKAKLSQNKDAPTRAAVIAALQQDDDGRSVAEAMRALT